MFVEEIRQTGSAVKQFSPITLNRSIASTSTIRLIQEMLVGVVERGTAKNIHTTNYQIAGKTGTAQVAQTRHGYRSETGVIYQSSFAGYFPADQPAYSMVVVIHNPKGWVFTGSQIAAPVFREVADKIYASQPEIPGNDIPGSIMASLPTFKNADANDLSNIYSTFNCRVMNSIESGWASTMVKGDTVIFNARENRPGSIPDVVGMGIRDALFVLENSGVRVRFTGRGIVRRQSIPSGTPARENQIVYLELH
jgi:cell division protein FtsI (penicillin-binding protein 3)